MTVSLIPASQFSIPDLRKIYNQSRREYLVPMQMEAGDMEKYIHLYQVDLAQSLVVLKDENPVGLGMLAIRENRSWITRVGVNPDQRNTGIGKMITVSLLQNSEAQGIPETVLEVLSENNPAQNIFSKFGFQKTRDLVILDKKVASGNQLAPVDDLIRIKNLNRQETLNRLKERPRPIAWTGQVESYQGMKMLIGYSITDPREGRGWLAFNYKADRITHLTWDRDQSVLNLYRLLSHLAKQYPNLPARIENIPCDDPMLDMLFSFGFQVSFRRVEMIRRVGGN